MQCVVIGSGCSGLTSALIMAKNGYQVTVVEKSARTAPLLQGFERKGFHFDTGVHCLSGLDANGPLRALLEYLNLYNSLSYKPFNQEHCFSVCFADGTTWNMPQGFDALFESLVTFFPDERQGIKLFLDRVQALSHDFQYIGDFRSIARNAASSESLQDVMDKLFCNSQIKICLGILNNLFCGLTDAETPFAFFASSIGTYFKSSGTFSGGGKALFAAMEKELLRLGGQIVHNNGVASVLLDSTKRATTVLLEDGTSLDCDVIIATCHPNHLPNLFPENTLRNIRKEYYQNLESTTSLLGIYGFSTRPLFQVKHGNIVIAPQKHPASKDDFANSLLSQRQMLITSNHSCPKGESVSILIPASYAEWKKYAGSKPHQRKKGYREQKKIVAAQAVEFATNYVPELKNNFTTLCVSTPLTIKDYCQAPNGAAYGVKRSINQFPPPPAFPVKNVLLSGQAIVGPGILGAMTAGFVTCGEILGHTHLRNGILECS